MGDYFRKTSGILLQAFGKFPIVSVGREDNTTRKGDEMNTEQMLKDAIEHAPKNPGKLAANLRGWWTPDGYYVCAACAGRIMARGCHLPNCSNPVWADKPEPYGVCCCCEN
jgi:hypothetical protein